MKTEKQMEAEAARSECEEADLVLAQAKEAFEDAPTSENDARVLAAARAFEAANARAEGGGE